MSKVELYEKIGEAVVNPSWELSADASAHSQIREVISEERTSRFIAHVQRKMAGVYYKGAVYTGDKETTKS
jgi:hypothetical protein